MKKKKIEIEKGYVYYGLRISFWIMILCWILATINVMVQDDVVMILALIWITATIHTFIVSIIHLTKHKNKGLAITALIISAFLTLLFFMGFMAAMLMELTI